MEKKWIEFAELFGDAFIELLEDEHTITITLSKSKVERVKNLLKKPLPEDDDIYVIDACCNSCGDSDYHYNKCIASLENGRCKNCIAMARNEKQYEKAKKNQTPNSRCRVRCYRIYKRKVRPDYLARLGETAFFDEAEARAKLEELKNK